MDDQRFDRLAKLLATGISRRGVIRGIAGSVAASQLAVMRGRSAIAAPGCRDAGHPCEGNQTCCEGLVCLPGERGRAQRCRPCPDGTVFFDGDCCTPDDSETTCGDACGPQVNNCGQTIQCGDCCTPAGQACTTDVECCGNACTCGSNPEAGVCQGPFFQGFDVDTSGWYDGLTLNGSGQAIVPLSNAYSGGGDGPFTRLGGYSTTFGGGFAVSLKIYLDMAQNPSSGTDLRFDYTTAVNRADSCSHRRDFIFNAGTDPTTAGRFVVSASNNAPGWPIGGVDPFFADTSGWYTFTHTFYDGGGGILACDLTVSGPSGSKTWTRSDPSDAIGTAVGGNRYAWIPVNQIPGLLIDDSSRA